MYKGERPTVHIEVDTFAKEAIHPMMKCTGRLAREVEYQLIHNFINIEYFDDGRVSALFSARL